MSTIKRRTGLSGTRGKVVALALYLVWFLMGNSPARTQVTDLTIGESGEDATLTWTTGVPPYRVYRSNSPDFYFGNEIIAEGLVPQAATDVGALRPGSHSHYYAVFVDSEANPPGFGANSSLHASWPTTGFQQ